MTIMYLHDGTVDIRMMFHRWSDSEYKQATTNGMFSNVETIIDAI